MKRKKNTQHEDQFYVLATSSLSDDRTLILKDNDTFAVYDRRGDIHPVRNGDTGIYHEGTRFVSQEELSIGEDERPLLLNSNVSPLDGVLTVNMMNADVVSGGELQIAKGALHIQRQKFLFSGRAYERLTIQDFSERPITCPVMINWGSDYRDIFEIRGTQRLRRGEMLPLETHERGMSLSYRGLDQVVRKTRIECTPAPEKIENQAMFWRARLSPGQRLVWDIVMSFSEDPGAPLSFDEAYEALTRSHGLKREKFVSVTTDNERYNVWHDRSLSDLLMLQSRTATGAYPYAGVPWYSTAFGRDGIITALQTLWINPTLAHGVLSFLADTQAKTNDPERDAEPGKIVHEVRLGEMAALREIPFGLYYGSVDSTPLFLILVGAYFERTGDTAFVTQLWPAVERALEWINQYGDRDQDGFVEYAPRSKQGLSQQGWKDSYDSIFHADGEIAQSPTALCEVQGYVYQAKQAVAKLAAVLGYATLSYDLNRSAEQLLEQFNEKFWDEELGTYVIALDHEKKPCRILSSNAGHCLFSGTASPEQARRIAGALLSPKSFSGWGIRTLTEGQARYNPMSYHNGSIWPHDNSLIAAGLARYGYKKEVVSIFNGHFEAALEMPLHRMPELFCGFERRSTEVPTQYPVACSPQAWASGSVFMMLQALLGLQIDAPNQLLRFYLPVLPPTLSKLTLRDLRVGEASVDLEVARAHEDVSVHIVRKRGPLTILVER